MKTAYLPQNRDLCRSVAAKAQDCDQADWLFLTEHIFLNKMTKYAFGKGMLIKHPLLPGLAFPVKNYRILLGAVLLPHALDDACYHYYGRPM